MANQTEDGFTLPETIAVILIVGILAAVSLPQYFSLTAKARAQEAVANLTAANVAQAAYYIRYGTYAPDLQTLSSDIKPETRYYRFRTEGNQDRADTQAIPKDLLTLGLRGCVSNNPNKRDPLIKQGQSGRLPPGCQ
ncbi:MAG: type IV pilin protein [Stenomitos frigidus ULC029]